MRSENQPPIESSQDPGIFRLHELTMKLSGAPDLTSALQEVLEAAIELQRADFGNIQIIDETTGRLRIVGHKGFDADFLHYFSTVDESAACGQALQRGQRVIVEDTETDESYAAHQAIAKKAGYRAVQSTLLRDSTGHIVGALSTHFKNPHRPSDEELQLTDLYASHAGNVIAAHLAQEKLRRNEERYTFLLALSDRKRNIAEPGAIKGVSSSMLGEFLGADCAGYIEMLSPSDFAMVEGEWRGRPDAPGADLPVHVLEPELLQELAAGRTVQINSNEKAQTFLGREFRAAIIAPVLEGGHLEGAFYVLQNTPRIWRGDEVTLTREVAARTWTTVVRAYVETELKTSERRLRTLVDGIPQLVWRAEHGGEWTWASSQWIDYTGISAADSRARGWLAAVHPEDREAATAAWAKAEDKFAFDAEYRLRNAQDDSYRFFRTRATPVIDEHGNVLEWLGTSTDINEMRQMQDHQQLLVAELQHRTRNLLAVVRSLGEQTFETSDSYETFWANFAARIDALSRAQKLLSRSDDAPVTLPELLDTELAALVGVDKSGVRLSGSLEAPLPRETVQSLALALHELTTNAIKHGALGRGLVNITWQVETKGGEKHLQIDWSESGADIDSSATRRGFGRELIEDALPYQHEAVTEWRLLPEGVRCSIRLPISPRRRNGVL